jgi:hypothetical protein
MLTRDAEADFRGMRRVPALGEADAFIIERAFDDEDRQADCPMLGEKGGGSIV